MPAVPALTPVTTPDAPTTVAIDVAPELHVPPEVVFTKVVVAPAQITGLPVLGITAVPTVITVDEEQPAPVV